jgi:hypothetical protein
MFLIIKKKKALKTLKTFSDLFSIILFQKLSFISKEKNSTHVITIQTVIIIIIILNTRKVRGNLFKLYLNINLEFKLTKFDLHIALLNALFKGERKNIALYILVILYKDIIKKIEFNEYI